MIYEPDQRHVERIIANLDLSNCKPVSSPITHDTMRGVEGESKDEFLDEKEAYAYRSLTARLNYLQTDRPDLQYACKECARDMSSPRKSSWMRIKRVG